MKVKIRKGDRVKLISGKLEYKGTEGEVIKVIPEDEKVVVQGINLHTKHQKQVRSPSIDSKCDAGMPQVQECHARRSAS
jgi:large subunit ribosomal protein L24